MAASALAGDHHLGTQRTWTAGAGQGKGRGQGLQALGCSHLCREQGAPAGQEPRTWCGRAELCLLNCAATDPWDLWGLDSILLFLPPRGGAIVHPVPATTIPNFLGSSASVGGSCLGPIAAIREETPAGSPQPSAQEASLRVWVPEGE